MAPSDPHVDIDEVARWLRALFATAPRDAFVELRFRVGAGMGQSFHRIDALDEAAAAAADHARRRDVYAGVLPRSRRRGGRQDLVAEARVVWADCDGPQSVAALRTFQPEPSMVVASGSGPNYHAYWLLTRPVTLDALEHTNRRLAAALHADPRSCDAARILRPAGTTNRKQQPGRPVRLATLHLDARVRIDELRASLPELSEPRRESPRTFTRATATDDLLEIAPPVYVEQLTGLRVGRDRKIRCPFHDDTSPSLHVYDEPARGWFCYGCGRGGSIYDFAALLWGHELRGADFVRLRRDLQATLLHEHRRPHPLPTRHEPAARSPGGFGLGRS